MKRAFAVCMLVLGCGTTDPFESAHRQAPPQPSRGAPPSGDRAHTDRAPTAQPAAAPAAAAIPQRPSATTPPSELPAAPPSPQRLAATEPPAPRVRRATVWRVELDESAVWLVLRDGAPDSWAAGPPVVNDRGGSILTRRRLRATALPPELRGVEGSDVVLRDADAAEVGRGRVTQLAWIRESTVEGLDDAPGIAEASADANRDAHTMIVGGVRLDQGIADRAVWAHRALETATSFAREPLSPDVAEHARDAFRGTARWQAIERCYREAMPGDDTQTRWDDDLDAAYTLWRADGGRRFVTAWGSGSFGSACGGEGRLGAMWALFELHADGRLMELPLSARLRALEPIIALDLDGDGTPTFVTAGGLTRNNDATLDLPEGAPRTSVVSCVCP